MVSQMLESSPPLPLGWQQVNSPGAVESRTPLDVQPKVRLGQQLEGLGVPIALECGTPHGIPQQVQGVLHAQAGQIVLQAMPHQDPVCSIPLVVAIMKGATSSVSFIQKG